jgi:hypothetical protein
MIFWLILTHLLALGLGVFLGAWRSAPEGIETEDGFVELERGL